MAKAVSERDGEAQEQRFARSQAAAQMILGFLPRDVVEAMLAGHCVMLHEVMTANVRTTSRSDAEPTRRNRGGNLVGLNKAFNDNLDRLESYRQRPDEGSRDASKARPPEPDATPDNAGPPDMPANDHAQTAPTEVTEPRRRRKGRTARPGARPLGPRCEPLPRRLARHQNLQL